MLHNFCVTLCNPHYPQVFPVFVDLPFFVLKGKGEVFHAERANRGKLFGLQGLHKSFHQEAGKNAHKK